MSKKNNTTRYLVLTAMLIALSVVLRALSPMIYFGGGAGMRLDASEFFGKLPAFLCGPLYGGIAGGLVDFLAYVWNPTGPWIFPITLSSILGGVLCALLWKAIRNTSLTALRRTFLAVCCVLLLSAVANQLVLWKLPASPWSQFVFSLGEKQAFLTIGLYVASLIGLIAFFLDALIARYWAGHARYFLKLWTVLCISNLIICTLDTFSLRIFIDALGKLNFWVVYLPRLMQELILLPLSAFVISYLLELYRRTVKQ